MGVEADAPLRRGSRIKRPAARYVPEAESTDTRAAGRKRVHTETREDTKRAKSSTDDEEEEEEEDGINKHRHWDEDDCLVGTRDDTIGVYLLGEKSTPKVVV